MSSSKRDKRAITSRSFSNRSKPTSANGKDDVSAITQKTGNRLRKRLGIHNLSCLTQEGLLMSCFCLSIFHFLLQMSSIYHQEYIYWNWEQFGVSFIGIFNIYASFSSDMKKESLTAILKKISKAENKWNVATSHIWPIVKSDELNLLFSNVLIFSLFFATLNSSFYHAVKLPVIVNGTLSLLLINMKIKGNFIMKEALSLGSWILGGSTLAWPEENTLFFLEISSVLIYTFFASLFFAVVTPFCTVYSTAGELYIPYLEVFASIISFILLLFPLLGLYLIQIHRSQFYRYSRELVKFYNEQEISALPLGDRVYGLGIKLLHQLMEQEIRSISWSNGGDISYLSLWCIYSLTLQMIGVALFFIFCRPSMTFQTWMLGIELCVMASIYLVAFHRPVYHVLDSSRAYSHSKQKHQQRMTNDDAQSSETASPPQENSPDVRQVNGPPSQNMQKLFSLDENSSRNNANANKEVPSASSTAVSRTITCWAQVHSMQSLEDKQSAVRTLLNNLAETTTFQQLQSSARKSSSTVGKSNLSSANKESKPLTRGLNLLSPTPSQTSLSMLQQLPLAKLLTEQVPSVLVSDAPSDNTNAIISSSDSNNAIVTNNSNNNTSKDSNDAHPVAASTTSFQPKQILKRAQLLTVEPEVSSTLVTEKDNKPSPRHQGHHHFNKFSTDNLGTLNSTVSTSSTSTVIATASNNTYKAKRFGSQPTSVQSSSNSRNHSSSSNTSNSNFNNTSNNNSVSHSISSGGKLSIDVSAATVNGNNNTFVHPQPNSPAYPSPSSVSSTSPGQPSVTSVPAVTIMSITHHNSGPITATSVTTTTTSSAASSSGTFNNTKSNNQYNKHSHRIPRGPK